MATFILYLVKSSLCLLLFYVFYKVLLSRETFFRFNRFVLLVGMIVCAVLPLAEIKTKTINIWQLPMTSLEATLSGAESESTQIQKTEELSQSIGLTKSTQENALWNGMEQNKKSSISPTSIIFIVYSIGLLITFALFTIAVFRMSYLIRKGKKQKEENYTLVLVNNKICPFSFGKYIVISDADYFNHPDEILTHEKVHARKWHSLDLLFTELFILLYWFNPAVWLLKKELQDVHEYEADLGVLQQGINATKYQLLLVKKAVGARSYAIANSFNQSKLKTRITMMLKRKSTNWARLRLVLMAPLAMALLQAFANPEVTGIKESLDSSEGTTILQNDQPGTKEYFDRKVDELLKKTGNDLGSDSKDYRVVLSQKEKPYKYYFQQIDRTENKLNNYTTLTEKEFREFVCSELLNQARKEIKKGGLTPQLVFVQIDPDVPAERVNELLESIAKVNEEINTMLGKTEIYSETKRITVKDIIPFDPVLVAINERGPLFSCYKDFDTKLSKEEIKVKVAVKFTAPKITKKADSSQEKKARKFKPPKIVKDTIISFVGY